MLSWEVPLMGMSLMLTLSIEQIAGKAGFGSATTFRERFQLCLGISPQRYCRGFRQLAAVNLIAIDLPPTASDNQLPALVFNAASAAAISA
ncbi:AraC family transcriptional regulator [Pseudomonas sp. NA-150]|uniref:AraC family transcriptional regulator n=1 Tax=Pseudomonas sp. NA-150 TaxID=3367525 RepID=UPI0037C81ADB